MVYNKSESLLVTGTTFVSGSMFLLQRSTSSEFSLILEATSHFFLLTLMMIHRITQDRNIPSVTAPRNMMKRITSTLRQFESEQSTRAPSVLFPATAPGNSCKNHNARLV